MSSDDWQRLRSKQKRRREAAELRALRESRKKQSISERAVSFLWRKATSGGVQRFIVPAGVKCHIRRKGRYESKSYTTTRVTKHCSCYSQDAEFVVFLRDGWVMRVKREDLSPGR